MKTTLLVPTMNGTKLFNRTLIKTKILEDFEKDYFKIKEKNLLEHGKEKALELEKKSVLDKLQKTEVLLKEGSAEVKLKEKAIKELKSTIDGLKKKKSSAVQENEIKKLKLQLTILNDSYGKMTKGRDNLEKERKPYNLEISQLKKENTRLRGLVQIATQGDCKDITKEMILQKSVEVIAKYKCKRRRRTLELFTNKILK